MNDGEIWSLDFKGDINNIEKIISFKKEKDSKTEEICVGEEERHSARIGIDSISPNGRVLVYWKKILAPECSGLWKKYYFFDITKGKNFFTDKFKEQNIFKINQEGQTKTNQWVVDKIFWLNNGDFIVCNIALPPFSGKSIYYYDKNQNKKWEIFDSFTQKKENYISAPILFDVKNYNHNLMLLYKLYYYQENTKKIIKEQYIVKKIKIGDKINFDDLLSGKIIMTFDKNELNQIKNIKIINASQIAYTKQISENEFGLYIFDIDKNTNKK